MFGITYWPTERLVIAVLCWSKYEQPDAFSVGPTVVGNSYACIGTTGTALQARLYRHGSAGTALPQEWLHRHGSTGTALQARLYSHSSTGTADQARLYTGMALRARARQRTQIGRCSQINPQVRADYALSTRE